MSHARPFLTALCLAIFAVSAAVAKASSIPFSFSASLTTGADAGTQFTGSGSYATAFTGVGAEYVALTSLNFTVLGDSFNLGEITQGGQAILVNGVLSYFTADFLLQPAPAGGLDNIAFGFGGPGIIGYGVAPGYSNLGTGTYTLSQTPEPSTGLLCALALTLTLGQAYYRTIPRGKARRSAPFLTLHTSASTLEPR